MTQLVKLSEIRAQFPMYADVPDYQLLGAVHKKFYSDIPREQVHPIHADQEGADEVYEK